MGLKKNLCNKPFNCTTVGCNLKQLKPFVNLCLASEVCLFYFFSDLRNNDLQRIYKIKKKKQRNPGLPLFFTRFYNTAYNRRFIIFKKVNIFDI